MFKIHKKNKFMLQYSFNYYFFNLKKNILKRFLKIFLNTILKFSVELKRQDNSNLVLRFLREFRSQFFKVKLMISQLQTLNADNNLN